MAADTALAHVEHELRVETDNVVPIKIKSDAWETLRAKRSEVRRIPLASIYIDPRFQRALGEHRKNQIKTEYHPQGIGVLVVAKVQGGDPDGSGKVFASIDGQTRIVAINELREEIEDGITDVGEPLPTEILAEVYEDLTVEEAAALFTLRNFQAPVPVRERERMSLIEGDPMLKEVDRQVHDSGYTLFSEDGKAATMPYVAVAKRIIRWGRKHHRNDLLLEALNIQSSAFGLQVGAINQTVLQVTANLLWKNPQLDEKRFGELLADKGTPFIIGESEALRARLNKRLATAVGIYLVSEYNGLRGVEQIKH